MPLPINSMTPETAMTLMQVGQGAPSTPPTPQGKGSAGAQEAAQEFEAMFLSEMFKPVFESIPVDDAFGGGKGEEVFRGILVQEYGKMMARAGGIGLSDHVREELIRMQADAGTPSQTSVKEIEE